MLVYNYILRVKDNYCQHYKDSAQTKKTFLSTVYNEWDPYGSLSRQARLSCPSAILLVSTTGAWWAGLTGIEPYGRGSL